MSFQWPFALVGLVAIPLLVALYLVRERRRGTQAARFGNTALLPAIVHGAPGLRRHVPLAILLVAVAALTVGVARPHATVSVQREEATVILAVDVSRSMTATDVRPTRLDAARRLANALLTKVPERYRVGVVSFASRAVGVLPPTTDRSLATAALALLRPGEGTALGEAVDISLRLGRRRGQDGSIPPTAVLLISDGANEGGRISPEAASLRARAAGVPVYTVLVGTPDGIVSRPIPGGFRELTRVPPSPETLRQVAGITGGRFFTAPDDERLREVYEGLGSRLGRRTEDREITDLFAGGAGALLLVGAVLSAHWFRRLI